MDQKLGATECAMWASALGMDESDCINTGINYAFLVDEREERRAFAGYSDEKMRDLAYNLTIGINGAMDERQLRFFNRSDDKLFALKNLAGAYRAGEDMLEIQTMVNRAAGK